MDFPGFLYEIAEVLLKVAINTITLTHPYCHVVYSQTFFNFYTRRQHGFEFCLNFHFGFSLQTVSVVLLLYIRHIVPGDFMRLVDVYSKGVYVQLYMISTCTVYSINNANIW